MSSHEGECSELTIAPQRAGLRPRLLAFALDYLVIAAYALGLAAVTLLAANPLRGLLTALLATPASRDAVAFVTVVLPVSLYFALQEGSARQGTWGKRRLGLRVTGLDGGPLPVHRALLRSAAVPALADRPHLPVSHPRLAAGAGRAASLGHCGLRPGVAAGDHLSGDARILQVPSNALRSAGRLAGVGQGSASR